MYVNGGGKYTSGIKCVFVLILINVLVFIILPGAPMYREILEAGALSTYGIRQLELWQFFSYMFFHGGFAHLLLNMWGLYLFGTIIAPDLGAIRFLNLYFISGITGAIFWLIFNWGHPASIIGASGALFGVMMATAMLHPEREFILLLFPMPLKTKTLVVVYAVIEIFSELGVSDNIAHLAHLGGFIGAYFYIRHVYKGNIPWDILSGLFKNGGASKSKGWKVNTYDPFEYHRNAPKDGQHITQEELDRILDKISEHGINSLTNEETEALKRAREQMKSKHG
ncbi:MAG: hypothetical protein A2017_19825 [Lentisphaerae bacterium GWF2_44_16]|nr:MAG: hypothetical protein A2017_19825 [Lentisphaerae bacterium GWF2_44_16]